jgi:DNA-directed RNA polymerase specialized sigma24 family protein
VALQDRTNVCLTALESRQTRVLP